MEITMTGGKTAKFGAAFTALTLLVSSTASAAAAGPNSLDPLVSLSVFGTASSRAAVCAAGAGAAAASAAAATAATAAAQAPAPGCVLPVLEAAPPPLAQGPVAVGPTGGGISALLPLIGIAALGGLAILLLENDEDNI